MSRERTVARPALLCALVASLAVIGLAGCAGQTVASEQQSAQDHLMRMRASTDRPHTPTYPYSTYTGNTFMNKLTVGDCLDDLDSANFPIVYGLDRVPCSESHDSEIYAEPPLAGGIKWPGTALIDSESNTQCQAAVDAYIGAPIESTSLQYSYYPPTKTAWQFVANRHALCVIFQVGHQSLGSVEGTELLGKVSGW